MNVYDSELIGSLLNQCGYNITDDIKSADAIFLNTCAIREKAEETVHNKLDSLQSLKKNKPELDTLSIGTTLDMEAAIAEGATFVRIGTAIFGSRNI